MIERRRHPKYLSTYLHEEGPWKRHFLTEPVKIDGHFIVDEEVERRLMTWVCSESAWGPQPPAYFTNFEYRKVRP
jgi:hypothetical protein